jgi:hypothetical protein
LLADPSKLNLCPIERLRDLPLLISYNLPVSGQVNTEAILRSQNKQQQQQQKQNIYILRNHVIYHTERSAK